MSAPAPITNPALLAAVDLVRAGMDPYLAGPLQNVTVAALRTACRQCGVLLPSHYSAAAARYRRRRGKRDDLILKMWDRQQPFDDICRQAAITAWGAARVIERERGVAILLPRRRKRRVINEQALNFADQLAREWLERRNTPRRITILRLADRGGIPVGRLQNAIRRIKRLDGGPIVPDTSTQLGDDSDGHQNAAADV